jgi:membrane protease YdiL (CAAX protease family)
MNRFNQFFRSVLPADPFQLFFLAGLVCLTIAPNLRWWPSILAADVQQRAQWTSTDPTVWTGVWVPVVIASTYTLVLASSAGYFFCLFSVRRPVLKIVALVILPALMGLSSIVALDAYIRAPFKSALNSRLVHGSETDWRVGDLWHIGSGLHIALAGLVLVAIFLARLALRESQLPLQMSPSVNETGSEDPAWSGCKKLIWFSVAACSAVVWRAPHILLFQLTKSSAFWNRHSFFAGLLPAVTANGTAFAVITLLMGTENRKPIRPLLRFTRPTFLLVGIALPVIVTALVPAVSYLNDRAHWAAHDFGRYAPPQLASYFALPSWWVLYGVLGVMVEEVTFRGVLQKYFVSRYGMWRGLFLVGIAWSAFHFFGDRYSSGSELQVVVGLSHRLAQCLILGFVLSWLTIRSGSLWPAILTHWLSNVGINVMEESTRVWWRTAGWLVVVCVLYKFWPQGRPEPSEFSVRAAEPESAAL